jgi:hypothetical protein
MRLAMDRNLSSLSLTQVMTVSARPTRGGDRRAIQIEQQRRKTARIALAMGVIAFAASLGVMVGELARTAFGG